MLDYGWRCTVVHNVKHYLNLIYLQLTLISELSLVTLECYILIYKLRNKIIAVYNW
jgi:hypothetical protein